jgi:hypothetical protein
MQRTFHHPHYGLFTGPHEAAWIRKMTGTMPADLFEDDFSPEGLIELATQLTAEMTTQSAVFGVAIEVGEEDLDIRPVAVYYYIMVDAGRTGYDPEFIDPSRVEEDIVAIPEWFHAEIEMARHPEAGQPDADEGQRPR